MEGGKLSPMHMRSGALRKAIRHPRRLSMAEKGTFCTETTSLKLSSISSSASSCDSDTNLHRQPILLNKPPSIFTNKRKSFMNDTNNLPDFSQSFPVFSCNDLNTDGTSKKYGKHPAWEEDGKEALQHGATHVNKEFGTIDNENVERTSLKRSTTMPMYQPTQETQESHPEPHKKSLPLNLESTLHKMSIEELKENGCTDKYQSIQNANGNKETKYTGWSTTVLGTGPFGWSDDLLNAQSTTPVGNNILQVPDYHTYYY